MKHNSKKWLKGLGLVFGALVLIVIGYVIYVFASYYRLEDMQRLTIAGKSSEKSQTRNNLSHYLRKHRIRSIQ